MWAATQAPHEVRAVASRMLGLDEHRIRVIMRDTGGGFGQKTVPFREDICVLLAAPAAARRPQVDRGPAGEPHVRRAGPPRARHRRDGLRRRRHDRRRPHRPRAGRRRLPDPVAGRHRGRRRDDVPRSLPDPGGDVGHDVDVLEHARPHRLPRPVGVRVSRSGGAARHRRPAHGDRPDRAAAAQLPRRRRPPVPEPGRACPTTACRRGRCSRRRSRRSTTTAFRREQEEARDGRPATSGSARAATWSRRRPAWGTTAPRGPRSASSRRARSTSTSPAGPPGTASRPRRCSSPPMPSAPTSWTSNTIQGDTAVTPFGLGTGGSRSGSMIAGAIATTAADAARAHRRHRRPQARGRARGHRAGRRPGDRTGHTADRALRSPRSPTSPTSTSPRCRPACRPGLEASGRYAAEAPQIWANATHICTCEVDPETGAVTLLRYIVERGLRADDQPQHRGGPDRRRHGAGDRQRPARAPRLRRGRQPRRHDVPRLPAAHHRRGPGDRARPHRDPGARSRRVQGRGGRRRHRGSAGGRQRRRRRHRPSLDITRLPITPSSVLALLDEVDGR